MKTILKAPKLLGIIRITSIDSSKKRKRKTKRENSFYLARFRKLYKFIFWTGYIVTLIVAFLPIAGDLSKIRLGRCIFEIRLDHLLHFTVYFMICMYYLFGRWKGFVLFDNRPLAKFVIVVLLLATISEFAQLFVPARTFNVFDWIANVSGLLIGLIVIKIGDSPASGQVQD